MIHVHIPNKITLRHYQQDVWNKFFNDGCKNIMLIEHRRAGKDDLSINLMAAAAILKKGYYFYMFPEHNQARRVIWDGITSDGTRFIDRVDKRLLAKPPQNKEMKLTLVNGSIIQVLGSNNYNSIVGTNPQGIVYSEFALQNPMARNYMRPIMAENNGWELLQTTPRGMNHAYDLYKRVKDNPDWYTKKLTVEDTRKHDGTPVVTKEKIQSEIDQGYPDELIQSEYYCDFEAAVFGAYYSNELKRAYNDKRIGEFKPRSDYPVYVSYDLGFNDATALWFVQVINNQFYFVHYYENNRQISSHYWEYAQSWANKNNVKLAFNVVPFDINQHDNETGKTRLQRARINYGEKFKVAPQMKIIDGIDIAKEYFPLCHFDAKECHDGIVALTEYHADYVPDRNVFRKTPYHNWASHGADSFRYWFQFYRRQCLEDPKPFIARNDYNVFESYSYQ